MRAVFGRPTSSQVIRVPFRNSASCQNRPYRIRVSVTRPSRVNDVWPAWRVSCPVIGRADAGADGAEFLPDDRGLAYLGCFRARVILHPGSAVMSRRGGMDRWSMRCRVDRRCRFPSLVMACACACACACGGAVIRAGNRLTRTGFGHLLCPNDGASISSVARIVCLVPLSLDTAFAGAPFAGVNARCNAMN